MKKYNLSNIMKRAHVIKSENAMNIWDEAKTPVFEAESIMIKRWFLNKNFTQNERIVIETAETG